MTLSLTCHSCKDVLSAETEDDLVALGQAHAIGHGHNPPPAKEHVLARIRRHNPEQGDSGVTVPE